MLYAGDDEEANRVAVSLAEEIGFEPIYLGLLKESRLLELLAMAWIVLARHRGLGRDFGEAACEVRNGQARQRTLGPGESSWPQLLRNPFPPSVDVTAADWRNCVVGGGGRDRRALSRCISIPDAPNLADSPGGRRDCFLRCCLTNADRTRCADLTQVLRGCGTRQTGRFTRAGRTNSAAQLELTSNSIWSSGRWWPRSVDRTIGSARKTATSGQRF
jgi:hypothetical protein